MYVIIMKLLQSFQSISFFFTVFNEKITGRRQFSSNEQILHKHIKTGKIWIFIQTCEHTDLYGFLIFEKTDFYHYHLATLKDTRPPRFCRKFNSEQLLFESFFDTTCIFGSAHS